MNWSTSFVERCELNKEECKQRLRAEIDTTIDAMFSFFMGEFDSMVRSAIARQFGDKQKLSDCAQPSGHNHELEHQPEPQSPLDDDLLNIELSQCADKRRNGKVNGPSPQTIPTSTLHNHTSTEQKMTRSNTPESAVVKTEPNVIETSENEMYSDSELECDCPDCEEDYTDMGVKAELDVEDDEDDELEPTQRVAKKAKTKCANTNWADHSHAHLELSNSLPMGHHHFTHRPSTSFMSCSDDKMEPTAPVVYGMLGTHRQQADVQQQGSRSYECSFGCGKRFYRLQHQADHERIHRGVRPYRCKWEACRYDAAQRSDVVKHIRMRHFNLPKSLKIQKMLNITDDRNPAQFVEVLNELL